MFAGKGGIVRLLMGMGLVPESGISFTDTTGDRAWK